MTRSRASIPRLALAGLALVALVATSVPAAAQAEVVNTYLLVNFAPPVGGLNPGDNVTLDVVITYSYGVGATSTTDVRVPLEALTDNDWYTATIDPPEVVFKAPQGQEGKVNAVAALTVTLNEDAVAFQKGNVTVKATAPQTGNMKASKGEKSGEVSVAFVPKTVVSAPTEVLVLDGGKAHDVLFTVRNEGNHEVRVSFDVNPGTATVTIPGDITLGVNEAKEVAVTVRTPWTEGMEGDIVLTAKTTPTAGEVEGDEASAKVHFQSASAVPGTGLPGLALAVGLVVLVVRHRRNR